MGDGGGSPGGPGITDCTDSFTAHQIQQGRADRIAVQVLAFNGAGGKGFGEHKIYDGMFPAALGKGLNLPGNTFSTTIKVLDTL